MKDLVLLLITCSLVVLITGQTCTINNSKDKGATNFESCQEYTTSSTSKVCCYVNGTDEYEVPISACNELAGTEREALEDLNKLEGYVSSNKYYYLTADCNLGKEISLCDPDDKKSETPLSADYCSKYKVVRALGVDDDSKCCYVSGTNVNNTKVYSCVGINPYIFTEEEIKTEIKDGNFKRLGVLTDIKIECFSRNSANFYTISIVYIFFVLLFILI